MVYPYTLALLHSEWPKLHRVLAILSATGLIQKLTTTVKPRYVTHYDSLWFLFFSVSGYNTFM